jgi:hypothetical protein
MRKYLSIFILLTFPLFLSSCSKDNRSVLNQYISTHNSHDVDKSLSFYTNDISFELTGTWIKEGKSQIRELEEWDAALNSKLSFFITDESGDSLFCKGTEENDWFKGVGINKIEYDSIIFIFTDGLIAKVIANPSVETNKRIAEAFGNVLEYTKVTGNNILQELIPNGEFLYSEESAVKWLRLFDEMKNSDINF